jgi:AcrR family transcriptional regulator
MVTAPVAAQEQVAPDTKERLLDVAERLFAEHGFESVSIRSLTAEAEVNLAAVNYHFGSKEALIEAVVARRVTPINQRRMELLEEIDLDGEVSPAEQIVAAFIDPVMDAAREQGEDNRFCKLMSRCMAARDDKVSQLVLKQFPEVLARFVAEIRKCFPRLSNDSAMMRLLFMAGAMAHSLFHHDKIGLVSEGRCEVPSLETLRDEMVAFLAPGLGAGEGAAT